MHFITSLNIPINTYAVLIVYWTSKIKPLKKFGLRTRSNREQFSNRDILRGYSLLSYSGQVCQDFFYLISFFLVTQLK